MGPAGVAGAHSPGPEGLRRSVHGRRGLPLGRHRERSAQAPARDYALGRQTAGLGRRPAEPRFQGTCAAGGC